MNPERAAGADLLAIIHNAIQQAINSNAAKIALRSYCDGAELDGQWGLRLKGLKLGEFWLEPISKPEPTE